MARRIAPKATIQAQLVAVRRAASSAALECRDTDPRTVGFQTKQQARRDALTCAAITLAAVRDSREALDALPAAQRDKLSIALAAAGFTAVRIDALRPMPVEARHG